MKFLNLPLCRLIIGNNWLQKAKAKIDFNLTKLIVEYRKEKDQIPIFIEKTNSPIPPLSTQKNILHYLKPEYKKLQDIDGNDYEAVSVSTATASDISSSDQLVEIDELPNEIGNDYNTLMTMTEGLIHEKSNKKITIPAKSSYEMKFNIPQSKHTRIIEINSDYDQYLQMNNIFLEPHEKKIIKTIYNDSDTSVCIHEGLAVVDTIEDKEVVGYEFLNTLDHYLNFQMV